MPSPRPERTLVADGRWVMHAVGRTTKVAGSVAAIVLAAVACDAHGPGGPKVHHGSSGGAGDGGGSAGGEGGGAGQGSEGGSAGQGSGGSGGGGAVGGGQSGGSGGVAGMGGSGGSGGTGGTAGMTGVRVISGPMLVDVVDASGQLRRVEIPISSVDVDVVAFTDDGAGGSGGSSGLPLTRSRTSVIDVSLPIRPAIGRQPPFIVSETNACTPGGTTIVSEPDVDVDVPPLGPGELYPRRVQTPVMQVVTPPDTTGVRIRIPPLIQEVPGTGGMVVRTPAVVQGLPQDDQSQATIPTRVRVVVPDESSGVVMRVPAPVTAQ